MGLTMSKKENTMFVALQIVEAVRAQQDVGLSLQRFAKGVFALRHHVVEDTASRENINCTSLQDTREQNIRDHIKIN